MIKVFEAFAGYGSQSMALRRLGIDFEVVGISEIDKYAIQAYMAVHGDTPNYGDISKIDWSSVPDFDFLTHSFPCTDISTAGQQKGLAEGSGTRSSLLWECRKAIEAKRPKYLLMENVKNLVSKKFTPYLKEWLRFLEGQGYSNYTKVLNAKDFGVPQNRERVFMVSILGDASFHFPKPFILEKRLKDVLESNVDESFYLSDKIVKTFLARNEKNKAKGNGFRFEPTMGDVVASSILTNAGSRDCDNYVYVVGNTNPSGHGMNGNVFDANGLRPTLTTNKGEGPRILDPISCAMRGRNPENPSDRKAGIELEQTLELGTDIANCITTVQKDSLVAEPKCVAYTRNDKGKVISRRLTDIANTIHGSTGCGGSTACFVAEPQVLTPKRTEYGKALRKDYDAGRIQESRHNMTELEPRTDGICNTITTVQKDNLLMEPKIIQVGNFLDDKGFENPQRGRVYDINGLAPNIDTFQGGGREPKIIDDFVNYRIRKLTPRECFRLMGVSEKDIDKIQQSGISKTQQYKMAGNSIVVDVLYYIFKKMFVDKPCEDAQLSLF